MSKKLERFTDFFVTLLKLPKAGEVKVLIAENHVMNQQLAVMIRKNKRPSKPISSDQFLLKLIANFIAHTHLHNIAVATKTVILYKILITHIS